MASRRGVAIVIALMFAFCLMLMFFGMFFQQRNVASHNRVSIQEKQAFFAARAAIQHFLLKAKLFPTELYDAVEFMQGKNPLCDFSEFPGRDNANNVCFNQLAPEPVYYRIFPKKEEDMNGNPKYFYIPLAGQQDVFIRIGSFYNPDYRYLMPGLADADPTKRYTQPNPNPLTPLKPKKFITYFTRDCTNKGSFQPPLVMKRAPTVKDIRSWSIETAPMNSYPYTMEYTVNQVSIKAMEGLRRYNEEAIKIDVQGDIADFQDKRFHQVQSRVQKITRRGALP